MPMSDEHKAALAQGRRESRAIKGYLVALGQTKAGSSCHERIPGAKAQRFGCEDRVRVRSIEACRSGAATFGDGSSARVDGAIRRISESWKRDSSQVAKSYSERKGISYSAWREIGVSADVLRRAGIAQTRRRS